MYTNILAIGLSIGFIAIVVMRYLEWYKYAKDTYNLLMLIFFIISMIECLALLLSLLLKISTFEIFWTTFSMFEVSKWIVFAYSVFFVEA